MLAIASSMPSRAVAAVLTMLAWDSYATEIALVGTFRDRAVLIVDGAPPRALRLGHKTPEGVKLIGVSDSGAVVEVDGRQQRLALGLSVIEMNREASAAMEVTLFADARGHFFGQGSINGSSVRFLVDTGASMVSMGASDARRAGINFRAGTQGVAHTANGPAMVWRHRLDTVRVGDVTLRGVDALVHENDLPFVLLGMSFLNRMDMQREGDRLVLRRRF